MKDRLDPADVIAERYYYSHSKDMPAIVIQLGRPLKEDDGLYHCSFRFLGEIRSEVMGMFGLDGLDCLENTLKEIEIQVASVNEILYRGMLRWAGSETINHPE
ncbi:MAG: hypothetical protein JWP63_3092 [Candidatus Solibacter sp.]|nr:hypothetical protein [Candidatus Solibacter sp.]